MPKKSGQKEPKKEKFHKPKGASGSARLKSSDLAASKGENPDGLPARYFVKSVLNTHDIMNSPVEKTIQMIDGILHGEKLFTM